MIDIKTPAEIAIMHEGGKILAKVFNQAKKFIKPGISKLELDKFIERKIIEAGAQPSFKNYKGFPASSCISINHEIVHGIPDNTKIRTGDIVGLDIGVFHRGFHTDSAITIGVGEISKQASDLINITKDSLDQAILKIKPDAKLGSIQKIIEKNVETKNYCLVRVFSGHGIGRKLQEEPTIPNYYGINSQLVLKAGMVICIEPMVIMGKNYHIKILSDGWTAVSESKKLAAHFEHTIAVTKNGFQVLT